MIRDEDKPFNRLNIQIMGKWEGCTQHKILSRTEGHPSQAETAHGHGQRNQRCHGRTQCSVAMRVSGWISAKSGNLTLSRVLDRPEHMQGRTEQEALPGEWGAV